MARGSSQATGAATTAQNNSNNLMGNSGAIFSDITPTLESTLANPQGFSPADEAAMETGAMQSAGGANAGAVGQGALQVARTKNAGGVANAIADSARGAGETLSKNLLGIRSANAGLKQNQKDTAIQGLEGLYGTGVSGGNTALGQVAPLVNADTEAKNASWNWAKYLLDPALAAAGQGAGAAAAGCWIAEAIYGVDDPRTHLVRAWLNGPFKETRMGQIVMGVYLAVGRKVASLVRRSNVLRRAMTPLFNKALREAQKWQQ